MRADRRAKRSSKGPRKIAPTAVWAGEASELHRLNAGSGACDPAWSPDGRRLAVTRPTACGFFPRILPRAALRVESKVPIGELTEYTFRAFSRPEWSPDGALVALLVTNGGTSWVEVFEASTGSLFYTSPPETYSFSWGSTARDLKVGDARRFGFPYPPTGR